MRFSRRSVLALLIVSAPAAGWTESPRELARQLVVEGNRLLTSGACAVALRRFERAKELYPASYKVEVNLGSARECLGQLPAAAEHFERFLKRADAGAPSEMVRGIETKVEGLRKKLARVTLSCPVEGAEVRLDGKLVGRTPLDHDPYLSPGEHRLLVRKAGHLPLDHQLTLRAGDRLEVIVPWSLVPASTPASEPSSSLSPPDIPEPPVSRATPIYKRWWFWTVLGVAVAGAVTAGVVATQVGGSDRLPAGKLGNINLE